MGRRLVRMQIMMIEESGLGRSDVAGGAAFWRRAPMMADRHGAPFRVLKQLVAQRRHILTSNLPQWQMQRL